MFFWPGFISTFLSRVTELQVTDVFVVLRLKAAPLMLIESCDP